MTEYKCNLCDKIFPTQGKLDRHKANKNPCNAEKNVENKCKYCSVMFSTKGNLDRHYNVCKVKNNVIKVPASGIKELEIIDNIQKQQMNVQNIVVQVMELVKDSLNNVKFSQVHPNHLDRKKQVSTSSNLPFRTYEYVIGGQAVTFYNGDDIAELLGYKVSYNYKQYGEDEISSAEYCAHYNIDIKDTDKNDLGYSSEYPTDDSKNHSKCTTDVHLLTYKGACRMITTSRSPKSIELADRMGIDMYQYKVVPHETSNIQKIIDVIGEITPYEYQYVIKCDNNDVKCNYRIDLYIPEWKIAIECDENNHRDRDEDYETTRERRIKEVLDCKFVRFNPDAENFNIFKVIGEIWKLSK